MTKMSRQQDEVDNLLEMKNSFYTGNYQHCINEAQKLKVNDPNMKLELDSFLYRSYIAQQKHVIVQNELKESSHSHLQPLKFLAEYFLAAKKESVLEKLEEILLKDIDPSNQTLLIVAATMYYSEHKFDAALRILHQSDSQECCALRLQIYLKMDRIDLARKELKNMQEKDEDAILTQLAQAWCNMAVGGDKLDDAYYIFQEIIDKYGATCLLLNGQATCFIHQGKYEEADCALQESIAKDSNNPDSLINLIVLSRLSGKPQEVTKRYLIQLQESHRNHPFVKEYLVKQSEFDRLVMEYKSSVTLQKTI